MTPKIERLTHTLDATNQPLGKLAVQAANLLRGKHKPSFVSHLDIGDSVIIKNCKNVVFTGNKINQKKYYRHSGYLGGIKEVTLKDLFANHPEKVIIHAVEGMLPKNRLQKGWLKRLQFEKESV